MGLPENCSSGARGGASPDDDIDTPYPFVHPPTRRFEMRKRLYGIDRKARIERAAIHVGSTSDEQLRFWAAMYPAYTVRRAAFHEMARRERMEAA